MKPPAFKEVFCATPELRLEALAPEHAPALFDIIARHRADLARYLPWVETTRQSTDTEAFARHTQEEFAERKSLHYAIRHEKQLVGVVGFHCFDWKQGATSIGFWLSPEKRGQGIMTFSCRALVEYGIEELGLKRFSLHCAWSNKRSRAMAKRLGFSETGVIKGTAFAGGLGADEVVYILEAAAWAR